MNERIRELAIKAGLAIDGYGYPIWGCLAGEDEKKEFLEKFAELIIKECSGVNYNSSFQDGEFHARELLEHFGVNRAEHAAEAIEYLLSKPWVGLTDKEILADDVLRYYFGLNGGAGPVSKSGRKIIDALEAKLRSKNT